MLRTRRLPIQTDPFRQCRSANREQDFLLPK